MIEVEKAQTLSTFCLAFESQQQILSFADKWIFKGKKPQKLFNWHKEIARNISNSTWHYLICMDLMLLWINELGTIDTYFVFEIIDPYFVLVKYLLSISTILT